MDARRVNLMSRRISRAIAMIALVGALGAAGCSDEVEPDGQPSCTEPGERFNPITGQCQAISGSNNGGATNNATNNGGDNNPTPDAGNNANNGGGNNTNNVVPDAGGGEEDTGPGNCRTGVDSDDDGLDDACECALATGIHDPDTDDDGLTDAEEDANGNCTFDPGVETDPRRDDTDLDGALDGDEVAGPTDPLDSDSDDDGILDGVELASCTDPLLADTDGDGLPDGVEDANLDGELGSCVNRVFDFDCAQGESDPCAADTDGDGEADSEEAQYRQCKPEDLQNLVSPQLVSNVTADYQLALEPGVTVAPVTLTGGGAFEAHVFEDATNGYTGFIASFAPTGAQTNPSLIADEIMGKIQAIYPSAVRRVSGRRITTHDGFTASAGSIADLPAGTSAETARDAILASLGGVTPAELGHGLSSTFAGDTEPTLFVYEVIARSATQYLVVGTTTTLTDYQDDTGLTGIRVDDLTSGTAVAGAAEGLVDECVAYKVTVEPQVDIIISLDASGSMHDEQDALAGFANEFTTLLDQTNVDWRVAVTSVSCAAIRSDNDLSQEYRDLWGAGGGFGFSSCFGGLGTSGENGALVGGDFTTDPVAIATRLTQVSDADSEYTLTMGIAAIDRSLPRTAGAADKIRPDAAVILIAVTDEEDGFFSAELSALPTSSLTLPANQQMALTTAAQPWIDFLLGPDIGATVFGLYWPPGEACDTGRDVAHAISHVVNETGGAGGSICQPDITNTLAALADASAGIASGLRLRGVPVAPTLQVIHGDTSEQTIEPLLRSRTDGFDYDPVVNRVAFSGPTPPQTGDTVVVPYRRWAGSVFMCATTDDCPAAQKLKCVAGECR